MKYRTLIALVFVSMISLFDGVPSRSINAANSFSPRISPEATARKLLIPELVANQISSGDLTCPNSDSLTYEACLLYQGALGIWQNMGFPENCPNTIGDKNFQWLRPKDVPRLSPSDALRAPTVTCFSYLYAIQVANVVPILVSTATRIFKLTYGKEFAEPGSDAELCLEARYGICGNQAATGVALFEIAGFKSRPVEFYYFDNQRLSHIIPEVMIDRAWRPVDTTYGAYWINSAPGRPFALMSLDDVLHQQMEPAKRDIKLIHNSALLPHTLYGTLTPVDYFDYLKPGVSILRGGQGEISLSLNGKKGVEKFDSLPNYIGDNRTDGDSTGVSFKFDATPGNYSVNINVSGSGFGETGSVAICIDNQCTDFSAGKKNYHLNVTNPSKLYLKSGLDYSYLVLASIEWEKVG